MEQFMIQVLETVRTALLVVVDDFELSLVDAVEVWVFCNPDAPAQYEVRGIYFHREYPLQYLEAMWDTE